MMGKSSRSKEALRCFELVTFIPLLTVNVYLRTYAVELKNKNGKHLTV